MLHMVLVIKAIYVRLYMSVMFLLKKVIVFVNFSFKFFIRILSNPINDNPLRPRSETMNMDGKMI